jgi:hypothetical protein
VLGTEERVNSRGQPQGLRLFYRGGVEEFIEEGLVPDEDKFWNDDEI